MVVDCRSGKESGRGGPHGETHSQKPVDSPSGRQEAGSNPAASTNNKERKVSKLILVRGLPGSGKSTLAKALAAQGFRHLEADMYFVRDGEYRFDPEKLSEAHGWCHASAHVCMMDGVDVVVSNTFVRKWEMRKYLQSAVKFGIKPQVITCRGDFGSEHDVPPHVVERMRAEWEEYWPGDEI